MGPEVTTLAQERGALLAYFFDHYARSSGPRRDGPTDCPYAWHNPHYLRKNEQNIPPNLTQFEREQRDLPASEHRRQHGGFISDIL